MSQKIIKDHLISGDMTTGSDVGIKIDQTLTQDATGTMAYLEFESMGIERVKTEKSVAYVDHNTLQTGFENADDHEFIKTIAQKHGIFFSRPGNGICHQVHLERFGAPCKTLIGSDSHTPTCGGLGMLAIGAGGMDVAAAMAGLEYHITMPKIVNVQLAGQLQAGVSAKDIILKVLELLTVKGGVEKIIEYTGDGVKSLSIPQRSTITNMGAELGATTSIFPSDEITREFLSKQNRVNDFSFLSPDDDAIYDETIKINLSTLIPLVAYPHSPDNIKSVREINNLKVDQICIGSCTNSSYMDLMKVATILKGKTIADNVSLVVSPGSRQVYSMLAQNGAIADLIASGARILECACGPCIGMGQSPKSGGVSLRTFNRNFEGRSGTKDAKIYLVSPETAAASAITGFLTDPTTIPNLSESFQKISEPTQIPVNDNMIIPPLPIEKSKNIEVVRGPNIKPIPKSAPLKDSFKAFVALKVGDNITTDHIMPAGAKILPYRSNIPYLSKFCFSSVDKEFYKRCDNGKINVIVAGENYGQGSSREHAALVPRYLNVGAVIAKSFARIHAANLINSGIIPLTFQNPNDYNSILQNTLLEFPNIRLQLTQNSVITLKNLNTQKELKCEAHITKRQLGILLAGGLLGLCPKPSQGSALDPSRETF